VQYVVVPLSRWERAVWGAIELASSVDLLGRFANWSGSRVSGMMVLMSAMTSLSKHFMATDVSALGWYSGTMVVYLKHVGITDWVRERLNIVSWMANSLFPFQHSIQVNLNMTFKALDITYILSLKVFL
jgi:hypothetical protein